MVTGSSAIQSIPIIAGQAEQLIVFQRTATYSAPAQNQLADKDEVQKIKGNYSCLREKANETRSGFFHPPNDVSALDVSENERQALIDERWRHGGLAFVGSFNDLM